MRDKLLPQKDSAMKHLAAIATALGLSLLAAPGYAERPATTRSHPPVDSRLSTTPSIAHTVFPGEIYRAPRSWGERAFKKLMYWNEVDKGGHLAAFEEPELFAAELRAAFRSLR